jgi:hypothetical protein
MTHLIPHDRGRYLRSPHLVARVDGATLYALAWDPSRAGDGESLVALELDADGTPRTEPRPLAAGAAIFGLSRVSGEPALAEDPGYVDRATASGWVVSIERGAGESAVVAVTPSGARVTVWVARATAAAPCIAPADEGAWIAFHHNLREDTGEPDLAKWIAVRFVRRDGTVLEPASPMLDRDRDRLGEEQGFEFPSLATGADGAVAIFGRGSHAFHRQDLCADGYAPRIRIGSGDWGCRGRWVAVCASGEGGLLIARREKAGLLVERVEAPRGGPPALVPTRVYIEARAHRDVPRRPAGADPAARDGRTTLFGDIHQHSAHSDGCGTADEPYLRARWVYGDDFGALTDHESFIGKRVGPGEWAYLSAVADRHDEPGAFATLIAYEWTGRMHPGPGHKVVYLPPSGGRIVSRDDVPEGHALLAAVKAQGGFAVPHHVGWTGADEAAHDPEAQPVFEICSCHGCYLHEAHPLGARGDLRDQMVEAVLRRGKRFGFIACSDGHGLLYHHGVARKRDPFRCGLTAVQAKERTRAAILEAIRERRCYATSGVPILLDLRADGAPMGSEVVVDGPARLRAEARCASSIASLALIGPAGVIASETTEGALEAELEAELDVQSDASWVYARVEQADGEMAWSSPIFFTRA